MGGGHFYQITLSKRRSLYFVLYNCSLKTENVSGIATFTKKFPNRKKTDAHSTLKIPFSEYNVESHFVLLCRSNHKYIFLNKNVTLFVCFVPKIENLLNIFFHPIMQMTIGCKEENHKCENSIKFRVTKVDFTPKINLCWTINSVGVKSSDC